MSREEIPILFTSKEECCGCAACYAICNQRAISMVPDNEGFLYPQIDDRKCIRCKRCIDICVFKGK